MPGELPCDYDSLSTISVDSKTIFTSWSRGFKGDFRSWSRGLKEDCCNHEQKESSKSVYCIFILLVAYIQCGQQQCQYTASQLAHKRWVNSTPPLCFLLLLAGSLLMSQLPLCLRCLMSYLHLPPLVSEIHSSFDSLDGVCVVGSPY